MLLSVIIVNYNVRYFLEQCLHSVIQAGSGMDMEVIVVDNASTDGSADYLQTVFPQVKFIRNDYNAGFAKANNRGLAQATGSYILFLNPDTILPATIFSSTIAWLQQEPQRGALGVKMLDGSGRFLKESKRAFPSPLTSFFKLTGMAALFPRSKIFARYYLGHLDENKNQEVDVLAGAFMLLPKKVLDAIGGYDERFFMYGEDVDLSYRVQQAGWKNYYFAETPIIHFKGESTSRGNLRYVQLFYKAMQQFTDKHYGGRRRFVFRIFINSAIWLRAGLSALGNIFHKSSPPAAPVTIREDALYVLAGNNADQQQVSNLLQHNQIDPARAIFTSDKNKIIAAVKNSPSAAAVVLCSNEKGFGDAIETAGKLPPFVKRWFHAGGSNSMVSSNSKDGNGSWLTAG